MISYYDIRAARTAMRALQNKPLRRRKLDIHFSIPKVSCQHKKLLSCFLLLVEFPEIHFLLVFFSLTSQDNPTDKDINQGTLVAFNLDPSVSNEDLRQIFGVYGEVKEVMVLPFFVYIFASLSQSIV